jgi:spermine oxidase
MNNYKTVIIGAGISGISAAIHLLDNNYDNFVIYEAQDRIGGRINTIEYGNFVEHYKSN